MGDSCIYYLNPPPLDLAPKGQLLSITYMDHCIGARVISPLGSRDMQVGKIKSELLKERKALAAKIEAIDQTLAGIDQYQGLNGRALPADPVPVKAAKRVKAKRAQPVVPCPDCGKRYKAGPGLAAHRKAVHGWKVGYPLYDPLPREV